jgi:hypothetical protein
MFTVLFSGDGLLVLDDLQRGLKMNSQYFCEVVREEARMAVITITKKSGIEEVMIHMEYCKVHNSAKTTKQLEKLQVTRLPYPPYSPDISPCDVWLFGWNKDVMQG